MLKKNPVFKWFIDVASDTDPDIHYQGCEENLVIFFSNLLDRCACCYIMYHNSYDIVQYVMNSIV